MNIVKKRHIFFFLPLIKKEAINPIRNKIMSNLNHIINCQKTGEDLFYRNIESKKIDKNFFPKDLLDLMNQNPKFYFGSSS